jgi:TetR/AcrR family transcriptional regulator, transcriptional repressor of aconitase
VPKVSEEHRTRRREEILQAARRCFARHGYEGATVARLEEESGLSRGAIFNYFGSKEEIFVALVERVQERLGRIWAEEGYAAALRDISAEEPAWLGVYIEATRRMRTDPEFAKRRREAGAAVRSVVGEWLERARASGEIRDDLPAETIGTFLGVVVDGLAVRAAAGLDLPDLDAVLQLVEDATGGAAPRTRARRAS